MTDYVRQANTRISFPSAGQSWVILSDIEQRIKTKIERIGKPLKDWDISINYGIKTGCNEAFIIGKEKRDELIEKDAKSVEIIRPILRGRDIKRYGYDFAELYLLYIPWHFPLHTDSSIQGASEKAEQAFIKQYPAIYDHLVQYKKKLSARNKAETGIRYEWYALQRWGANYMDEFYKQKIIWGEISDKPKFALDYDGIYYPEATTFILTGEHTEYLFAILNSKISEWFFSNIGTTTGVGTVRWKKFTIEQLLTIPPDEKITKEIKELICALKCRQIQISDFENETNLLINNLYDLNKSDVDFINNYCR
ncbi:MAG: hypothetical protein LBK73_09310 [Treponema sp.]|nr:hypothetical protein [Treponema sp.]